jgi:hypothetical protein
VDKNSKPFSFQFENQGDVGKLGSDGLFLANQAGDVIYRIAAGPVPVDFSWIRIRETQ